MVNDIKWIETYINILDILSEKSKCSAKKVACILVKNNIILSTGINGSISGKTNCCDIFKKLNNIWYKKAGNIFIKADSKEHHKWSQFNEIHAEINAIKKATQDGNFNIENSTAIISYSPCFNCAKTLVLYGVTRIIYKEEYDDIENVRKFLEENNVEFIKYEKERCE